MTNAVHIVANAANSVGEDALSALLFANTPSYLVRHLVLSGVPDVLASKLSNTELVKMVEHIQMEASPTAENLVCLFSAIIALASKGGPLEQAANRGRVLWVDEAIALAKLHFNKANSVSELGTGVASSRIMSLQAVGNSAQAFETLSFPGWRHEP